MNSIRIVQNRTRRDEYPDDVGCDHLGPSVSRTAGRSQVAFVPRADSSENPQQAQPSSTGFAWPKSCDDLSSGYDQWNRRVKLVYPSLIDNQALLDQTISSDEGMMVTAARLMREHPDATRLTLRCILRDDLSPNFHPDLERDLRRLRHDITPGCSERVDARYNNRIPTRWLHSELARTRGIEMSHPFIEAKVSLGPVLPGFYLAYIGCNSKGRSIPEGILRAENHSLWTINHGDALNHVDALVPVPAEAAYERIRQAGFVIEPLANPSADEISRLTQIYLEAFQAYLFDINEGSIGEVIRNSTATLVARNNAGQIIASLVAEQAMLELKNGPAINFVELSEAATDKKYRGYGLLTALYHRMIELLHDGYHSSNTIVYAEARAPWIPVNIATRKSGPNYCGLLSQHCQLRGDRSTGMEYEGDREDLAVWAYSSF